MRNEIKTTVRYYFINCHNGKKREHEKSRMKEVRKAGGGRVGGRKEEKKVKEILIMCR